MLIGRGADEMAKELGFDPVANSYFTTSSRKAYWEQTISLNRQEVDSHMGTVGAVVLDSHGHLAAGGSTGGPTGKKNGRIGDTAVLGAGLYADTQLSVVWSVMPFDSGACRSFSADTDMTVAVAQVTESSSIWWLQISPNIMLPAIISKRRFSAPCTMLLRQAHHVLSPQLMQKAIA